MRIGIDARAVGRGLGIATFITGLAERVASLPGRDVILLGGDHAGLPSLNPPVLRPYPALDSPAGRALARRARLDVVHFTANSGWMTDRGTPFVLTVHDAIFLSRKPGRSPRQQVGHAYQRQNVSAAVRAAAAVASPSAAAAEAVRVALGLAEPPQVIPNGVDVPAFAGGRPFAQRDSAVAFGGRDSRKRLDAAYRGWREAGWPSRLVVLAGAGLPPGFEAEAAEDVAAGRVEILGYQSAEAVSSILAEAAALVYPSEDEGFGLPIIEAMGLGAPVITGACEATREVAGGAALDLAGDDPVAAVAHGLRRLREEPGLAERLIAAGRVQAARFNWDRCAESYVALYDEAAG